MKKISILVGLTQIGNTPGVTILSRAKDSPGVKENLRKSFYKRRGHLILLLLFFSSFVSPPPAKADSGLKITPSFFEFKLDTFGTIADELVIYNQTDASSAIELTTLVFSDLPANIQRQIFGGMPALTDQTTNQLSQIVEFEPSSLVLEPSQRQTVKLTILNSATVASGMHYGVIKVVTLNDPAASKGVLLNSEVYLPIFLEKDGARYERLTVSSFKFKRSNLSLPAKAIIAFTNDGNVHLVPRGTVTIRDPRGRFLAQGVINDRSLRLFPGTTESFEVPLKRLALLFIPGIYHLDITYRYDGTEATQATGRPFFVLGLPSVAGLVILIIGIGIFLRRKYH